MSHVVPVGGSESNERLSPMRSDGVIQLIRNFKAHQANI
jgi:sulfur transfer protein SufE